MAEASLATVIKATKEPFTMIIDVREPSAYNYSHIPKSTNVPLNRFAQRLDLMKKAQNILLYGKDSADEQAVMAAELLAGAKLLSKTSAFRNGWAEWSSCHLPVESSSSEIIP